VDRLLATKSEGVGLIVRAVSFQDFQPMLSQITNVTDRQTDDMRSRDRAYAPELSLESVENLRDRKPSVPKSSNCNSLATLAIV